MAEVATVLGIASFGIQVCQGLLSYYDSWSDYNSTIRTTYGSISDMYKTLSLLHETLSRPGLDPARTIRVEMCLESCVTGLDKLQRKLQKLQTHHAPTGYRQRARTELQRSFYPFRESTLAKLREIIAELRQQLSLALQVLQLESSTTSEQTLDRIEATTRDTAANVRDLQQAGQSRKIIDWLSPPDPWRNHAVARQLHHPRTGDWLIRSEQYNRWKRGDSRHLWLHGKPGCGKTILASTVIQDLQSHCQHATNSHLVIFYFSFSDKREQSPDDLLRSIVAQLGTVEPGRSILGRECDRSNQSSLEPEKLKEIFLSCIVQYDEVFLALDALDECPERSDFREDMLDTLRLLSQKTSNVKIFATSRDLGDIRAGMDTLKADVVPIVTRPVDADIGQYVESELLRDQRLSRLDEAIKGLIKTTFAERADGMFRWAYCQLQELKMLKSTRPSHVRAALPTMSPTLDETYERLLLRIDSTNRDDALVLLQWLAYAETPLCLEQLVEATVIDLSGEGCVLTDDRGGLTDTLDILAGLVTTQGPHNGYEKGNRDSRDVAIVSNEDEPPLTRGSGGAPSQCVDEKTVVRLAHFSVKEYLESERMRESSAQHFHRDLKSGAKKTSTMDDAVACPLLEYAAQFWLYHIVWQLDDISRAGYMLSSHSTRLEALLEGQPDFCEREYLRGLRPNLGSRLYHASATGLRAVNKLLMDIGMDANARGGQFSTAPRAASSEGQGRMVQLIIDAAVDCTPGKGYTYRGNAIQATQGHRIMANLSAPEGHDVTPPRMTSLDDHKRVAKMLVDAGSNANTSGERYGSALQAAFEGGQQGIAKMLIDHGATPLLEA